MPSVAPLKPTFDSLKSNFPLTAPVPTPLTHPNLISTGDLTREEDLLRNPLSFRHWWTAIQTTKDAFQTLLKAEPPVDIQPEIAILLGPLASPTARLCLQRLTYLYESALHQFPGSFKLWKSYLHMRMSYVLGKFVPKKRAGGRKKFPDMKDALADEKEDLEEWVGGLDGIVGFEEWKSLIATFERALMWLPNVSSKSTWFSVILILVSLVASPMAALRLDIQPPYVSGRLHSYACSPNIRSCFAHLAPFLTQSHLGSIPSLGRGEGRFDLCGCL